MIRSPNAPQAPYRHRYSLECVAWFLSLVLSAATSLRGAGRALALFATSLERPAAQPAWTTGRLWLLRVGYYQLMRPKVKAGDWVWVVDHTVQLGQDKCLVILGVRLSAVPPEGGPLTHAMMEPLALIPVRHSNGLIVEAQLEATTHKTGIPREILSDHGTDLHAGIEQFCARHRETVAVYDIKHKTAAVLKHALEHDPHWEAFTQHAYRAGRQMQQTPLAALVPPSQKTKARYLNVHELVTWGKTMLALVDRPKLQKAQGLPSAQVQEKLGWLRDDRARLAEWGCLFQMVSLTEHFIRHRGLDATTVRDLERRLRGLAQTPMTRRVRRELLDFVAQETAKAHPHERLLGSSEVIESVLGKQKRLEQHQAKSGFTGLLLGACAIVANPTREIIQQALESVSTQQVSDWRQEMLGPSLQSQRRAVYAALRDPEQKWDQKLCPT